MIGRVRPVVDVVMVEEGSRAAKDAPAWPGDARGEGARGQSAWSAAPDRCAWFQCGARFTLRIAWEVARMAE